MFGIRMATKLRWCWMPLYVSMIIAGLCGCSTTKIPTPEKPDRTENQKYIDCWNGRPELSVLEECTSLIQSNHGDRRALAELYVLRGQTYDSLNDHEHGVADYNKATSIDPTYDMAFIMRGNLFFQEGRFEQAIQDFSQAIELKSLISDSVFVDRGRAYAAMKRYKLAIDDFNAVIRRNGHKKWGGADLRDSIHNRGLVYEAMGQEARAVADFARAKTIRVPHID
jgi:tetratricopeptide (TPR) repeat protein